MSSLRDTGAPSVVGRASGGYGSFDEACAEVLRFLRRELPMQLWAVTRVVDDDWVMLATDDAGYGIEDGSVFRWSDSFCSRMVEGLGPQVAEEVREVPAYLNAPIGRAIAIRSYVGIPLRGGNGALLGTLCAIDPAPRDELREASLPLLELLAGLLAGQLSRDIEFAEVRRRAEQAEIEAMADPLTGLPNRRAWERSVLREERRCRQSGQPACVLLADIDGLKEVNDRSGHAAGDELLVAVARTLASALSPQDIVARIGGDEFAAILVDRTERSAVAVVSRLRRALSAQGLAVTIGFTERDRTRGLAHSLRSADEEMYRMKPPGHVRPDRLRSDGLVGAPGHEDRRFAGGTGG